LENREANGVIFFKIGRRREGRVRVKRRPIGGGASPD